MGARKVPGALPPSRGTVSPAERAVFVRQLEALASVDPKTWRAVRHIIGALAKRTDALRRVLTEDERDAACHGDRLMAADNSDRRKAELAYVVQRMAELDAALQYANSESNRELEAAGLPLLDAETITLAGADQLQSALSTYLRQLGNPDLADAYAAAHHQRMHALRVMRTLRAAPPNEPAVLEAAEAALEKASEHFERIVAAASAYLKRQGDEVE